ncbi:Gfo/Idh/MocA family protein [Aerococcus urinae]|uniref:Gfo/Idh/MocA family protein n=1 Tax=Aerococcus urinae TaxID=1376 RepID=UPI0018A6EEAE|nr:Gfo/Idh/MocA family oxidoreductase [Aerococcus urinae]
MDKKLNVAVIGAGIYGIHHVDVYNQSPYVNLVAVCDFSSKIRENIEKEYGVKTYSDVETMLSEEEIDAVSIVTPDHLHREPAVQCANAGKHLLIEKPLASTVEDCQAILETAEANNVRVAVDFHKRWDPTAIHVFNTLNDGDAYPIRGYMSMDDIVDVPTKWFKWADQSDPVNFLGIHCVDLIRWYMGCEATEVYAVGTKKILADQGIDSYDSVTSLITFENGCNWVVENSWVLPSGFAKNNDGRTSILTTDNYIRVDNQDRGIEVFDSEKQHTPNVFFFNNFYGKVFGFGADPINSFIDCLINDKEFVADGNDGLQATKITEAIHKSLDTGERVKIK